MDIMNGDEAIGEHFIRLKKMTDVGFAEMATGITSAAFFQRRKVFEILALLDALTPLAGPEGTMAGNTRRLDAVEHVDAKASSLDKVIRIANAHEIMRFMLGHEWHGFCEELVHNVVWFTDAESTNAKSWQVKLSDLLDAELAQIGVHAALDDAEKSLTRWIFLRFDTALEPTGGALEGIFRVAAIGSVRDTLIKGHDDVGAKGVLNFHDGFRREKMLGAVEMGAEKHTFFRDLAQIAEAEHLEAAAIGEDWAIPVHEAVETAELTDKLMPWPQIQVIGIGKNDLRFCIFELVRRQGLDSGLGADGHEGWGFDLAVRCG